MINRRFAMSALAAAVCHPGWSRAALAAAPVAESGAFRMSMQPWIGYALWYVARDKGIFEKQGLKQVKFVNYSEDANNLAILAGGAVEASSTGTQGVLQQLQQDAGLRVVMLEDESTTGDSVIAPKALGSVADLRGKAVAYEMGSTSHLLIADALAKAGMKLSSIKSVHVPAAEAAATLIAGRVDAAVTYEPYLSAALSARPDLKRLYSAAMSPGLISDCLLVTAKALATRPGQVAAMVRSWGDAQQAYQRNPAECQAIMAKGLGADPDTLGSAFAGVHYYSLAESRALMPGDFSTSVLPRLNTLCAELGLIGKQTASDKIIDMTALGTG